MDPKYVYMIHMQKEVALIVSMQQALNFLALWPDLARDIQGYARGCIVLDLQGRIGVGCVDMEQLEGTGSETGDEYIMLAGMDYREGHAPG